MKTDIKKMKWEGFVKIIVIAVVWFAILSAKASYPFQGLAFDFGGENAELVSSYDTEGTVVGYQSKPVGTVVDPEGKIWVGFYNGFSTEVYKTASTKIRLTGLRCFLPDTTEASFSPVELILFPDGSRDTLYEGNSDNGYCTGLSSDKDGNILYTAGPTLYKLDYHDGSGLAKFNPLMVGKPRRTYVSAVQDCSYIYFPPYPQFEQLHVLDTDLNFVSAGLALTPTLQNAIEVRTKSDGTVQLFSATHLNGEGIFVYESSDPATVPFALTDTVGNFTEETDTNIISYYAWANFLAWVDKEDGILLYGNDHRAYTAVNTGNAPAHMYAGRWVALDVDNNNVLYTIGAPWFEDIGGVTYPKEVSENVPETYLENEAMGMRPVGACRMDEGDQSGFLLTDKDLNCVQYVSRMTGIDEHNSIPYKLELSQNYPNPFNPFTSIRFVLNTAQTISLIIYDLNGRIAKQIFRGYLDAGIHNITVDASDLASGTYIYALHTNALTVSRKMTVLK